MKMFLKIVLSVFILFVLVFAGGMFYMTRGLETGTQVEVNEIKLSSLDDGTYNGKYKSGRWTNEVKVTIQDQKIVKIDVVKDVVFRDPEVTQKLINSVIGEQNTNVDVVTGATITSKAYLKSIENALQ